MRGRLRAAVLGVALLPRLGLAADDGLVTWRLDSPARADDRPLPVGSLQKPFVAEAWARAHPGAATPTLRCDRSSVCWRPAGHGVLGLERALALSCNAYFRQLAADTPRDVLEATLVEAGFVVPRPLSPDAAIGLGGAEGSVVIRPSELLAAYRKLTRDPWAVGDAVRQVVLAGLRASAVDGTAAGLGARGSVWAKTGTVPALDGRPLATSGWAIVVDDAGGAILGLLPHGTGRDAARALAEPVRGGPPRGGAPRSTALSRDDVVRVRLFDPLRPRRLTARNLGGAPVGSSRGFVGPGASVALAPGDQLEAGLWEVQLPERGLLRRIAGGLAASADVDGRLALVAEVTPREYVAGVLLAELPGDDAGEARRVELGAAVLRFLAGGPRHGAVDVCDSTHCAWFLGRGPRVRWSSPTRVALLAPRPDTARPALDDGTWTRIEAGSRTPGPRQWTADCGGAPLSGHFVWGNGDRSVVACPRHGGATGSPWTRTWSDAALAGAFAGPVTSLAVTEIDGVWTLRVGDRSLRYDEAHRRLAAAMGWDALPSPADRVRRVAGGWEAHGVGSGHRVGLCLAD